MLRGIASFGPSHELRTDVSLSLSEDPPVAIAAVDVEPKIRGLVDEVTAMTDRGLMTLERARLVTRNGTDALATSTATGDAAKLTVYVGRQERVGRDCAALRDVRSPVSTRILPVPLCFSASTAQRMASVTGPVFRPQRQRSADDHRVGTAAQVSAVATELAAVVPNPLLTVERVRLCKRDGELFARPQRLPDDDSQGDPSGRS